MMCVLKVIQIKKNIFFINLKNYTLFVICENGLMIH